MIDLTTLTDAEIQRLESLLHALPADQALDDVEWERIALAIRTTAPSPGSVADLLSQIESTRHARNAAEEFERRLKNTVTAYEGHPMPPFREMSLSEMQAFLAYGRDRLSRNGQGRLFRLWLRGIEKCLPSEAAKFHLDLIRRALETVERGHHDR